MIILKFHLCWRLSHSSCWTHVFNPVNPTSIWERLERDGTCFEKYKCVFGCYRVIFLSLHISLKCHFVWEPSQNHDKCRALNKERL